MHTGAAAAACFPQLKPHPGGKVDPAALVRRSEAMSPAVFGVAKFHGCHVYPLVN